MYNRRLSVFVVLISMILSTLACSLPFFNVAPQPKITPTANVLDENTIAHSASTEQALFKETYPTSTPLPVETVNDIQIHYVYTDGLVTSLYHLYGTVLDHFVDITLTNNGSETATLLVETWIEGYTTTASDTVDVTPGEELEIHQNPRLIPESVDKLNSEHQGNFNIKITQLKQGEDDVLIKDSQQILMYSRRDFVWLDGFSTQEEYEFFAAWVTPTDPAVEELIRKAADYTESGMMWSGYGGNVNDEGGGVWERLAAIWQAESNDYRLTYISTMTAFGPQTVQRMRMPYEVIEQASGNCIELTTLYASAAEALGLEAAIIRIPGHAYIGVRMDQENANYYFIETTLMGQTVLTRLWKWANRNGLKLCRTLKRRRKPTPGSTSPTRAKKAFCRCPGAKRFRAHGSPPQPAQEANKLHGRLDEFPCPIS